MIIESERDQRSIRRLQFLKLIYFTIRLYIIEVQSCCTFLSYILVLNRMLRKNFSKEQYKQGFDKIY